MGIAQTNPIYYKFFYQKFKIYHYDLYRIKNNRELEELDFFENILSQFSANLVELPGRLLDPLPPCQLPLLKTHLHLLRF